MHIGQVCFWNEEQGFGKILRDDGGKTLWYFRSDLPPAIELKVGIRVSFDVCSYIVKGQRRNKAVHLQIAAPLEVAAPGPMPSVRAAKPKPVMPSVEALSKLVNVEPSAKRFVRI